MKVLFFAPYIYAPEFEEHSKNKTGFGFMVYDIAKSVGKLGDDVIVAAHAFGPERQCDGFKISKNSVMANILRGHYIGMVRYGLQIKKTGASSKEILKSLYYYLNIGYLKHLVKKEKPEVVHIHGCGGLSEEIIEMLRKLRVPYVVTLHGLIQYDVAGGSKYHRMCEQKLVAKSYDEKIPMTVIASGMKDDFLSEYYSAKGNDHVNVITNGIDIMYREPSYSIHEKYEIPKDKKIILCVGSICPTKNQKQTVRSFSMLDDKDKENSVVLFVGSDQHSYSIAEDIAALGLDDKMICTGFVPRNELHNYYSAADITVMASIVEGFGLSMVEGFVYGTPAVAFSDIAAIPDIYNEEAMMLCDDRSDEAFANTISKALHREWNKAKIKAHSKKFSLEAMAEKYHSVYENIKR